MKHFRDEVGLHIHHLDDDEEADLVVAAISEAAAAAGCRIERPTEETNSVFVYCEDQEAKTASGPEQIERMLENATSLISALTPENVGSIYDLGLGISLTIQTAADRVWLDPDLLSACARHRIGISVYDMEKFMKKITFPQEV